MSPPPPSSPVFLLEACGKCPKRKRKGMILWWTLRKMNQYVEAPPQKRINMQILHKKESPSLLLRPPAGGLEGKGKERERERERDSFLEDTPQKGINMWRLHHKRNQSVNPPQKESSASILLPPPAGGLGGKSREREREG